MSHDHTCYVHFLCCKSHITKITLIIGFLLAIGSFGLTTICTIILLFSILFSVAIIGSIYAVVLTVLALVAGILAVVGSIKPRRRVLLAAVVTLATNIGLTLAGIIVVTFWHVFYDDDGLVAYLNAQERQLKMLRSFDCHNETSCYPLAVPQGQDAPIDEMFLERPQYTYGVWLVVGFYAFITIFHSYYLHIFIVCYRYAQSEHSYKLSNSNTHERHTSLKQFDVLQQQSNAQEPPPVYRHKQQASACF